MSTSLLRFIKLDLSSQIDSLAAVLSRHETLLPGGKLRDETKTDAGETTALTVPAHIVKPCRKLET